MMEIVKYDNYMNELEFKGFTAADFDFLMYLCAQMRDQNEDTMVFSLNEIRTVTGFDYHATQTEFVKKLEAMNKKLMGVTATVRDKSKTIMFVLFPTFMADEKTNTLTVRVNPDFKFLLNELTKNFTMFELQEFTELSSKYSKTLYRLLKQYRKTGVYHVTVSELRKLLGCPESYANKKFMQSVIVPAVKELQEDFPTLSCEPIRAHTKGRPVTGYQFTFEAEGQVPGQTTLDQAAAEMQKYAQKKKAKKPPLATEQRHDYDYADLERVLLRNQ